MQFEIYVEIARSPKIGEICRSRVGFVKFDDCNVEFAGRFSAQEIQDELVAIARDAVRETAQRASTLHVT